jgi:hypothetical protein
LEHQVCVVQLGPLDIQGILEQRVVLELLETLDHLEQQDSKGLRVQLGCQGHRVLLGLKDNRVHLEQEGEQVSLDRLGLLDLQEEQVCKVQRDR